MFVFLDDCWVEIAVFIPTKFHYVKEDTIVWLTQISANFIMYYDK